MSAVWAVTTAATWLMTGVIWVIQLVHYPMFADVSTGRFGAFHARHSTRITWIVLPAMTTELVGALVLVYVRGGAMAATSAALAMVTWLVTGLLSVPAHNRLARGFDVVAHGSLLRTNWLRTAAFTSHGLVLLRMAPGGV